MTKRADETKEKLIQAGIRMFAKYGYEGASVKMIVGEAGFTMGTISLHFKNKENFYRAVLRYAARESAEVYRAFYAKVQTAMLSDQLDADAALRLIEELVDLQLYMSIGSPHPEYMTLLYWEQVQPRDGFSPITDMVSKRCEEALAYLLMRCQTQLDENAAIILSRMINGGIIAYGEHPLLVGRIKDKAQQSSLEEHVRATLKPFIVNSIRQYIRSENQPELCEKPGPIFPTL